MKTAITLLLALSLASCSFLNDVGQYAQDNPIIVDAATRQAVFRYIDAGETEADKNSRAEAVVDTVRDVDSFLQGSPTSSVDTLLGVVEAQVKWGKLSTADRFLVQDILSLVRLNLENKQREGLLDPEAVIGIRALLETALQAALLL